ncbi:MAG: AraC family transcriptional regulator [Flavobacteriaceae bacterium]|uniref:Helix-turn-helix transcriptional regulator n=1 Tax=Flavobacterium kayseriense TaxID=2764714 RepID=A0ABR7JAA0_9FLAO|nr:AraC family transcriptional regulator [Flavobacterium kayseriense]MBC5842475.1 helix-turn-helix transcriptional regulator [Flavobacterium kayseriense]MBC5849005.1 helix-turn-helix transcriptional regulator [Flavobacterium kayseriense]MBX9886573.1 AraC family transcriptional regulator [Flavobacteriaceae bacterium]
MKLYIKYDGIVACRVILQEQLERLDIKYQLLDLGEIEISGVVPPEVMAELQQSLNRYSIFIVDNEKSQLIQRIKDTIVQMIYENEKLPSVTISQYLSDKLNFSYGYITNIFTEHTYSSIENFIIIQKIERAKKLIIEEQLTLTEVSYKLNYSSVAYLSSQFKKVTGLTPSAFKRIVDKRRSISS